MYRSKDSEADEDLAGDRRDLGVFVVMKEAMLPAEPPADVGIIIEGCLVMQNITGMALAVALLFGLIYSLNLAYPKPLKYFFEVIQKVIMRLDEDKLTSKIQNLKNKLFS